MAAPAQSRVVVELASAGKGQARALLSHKISQSAMPDRAVSAPLRRMTNPRGAISARFRPVASPGGATGPRPGTIMARLNNPTPVVPVQRKPAGWVTMNHISDQAGGGLQQSVRFERTSLVLDAPPQLGTFAVVPEGTKRTLLDFEPGPLDSAETVAFLNAARAHQDYINGSVFGTIWQNYKFVFSGGNGIVYGVDPVGRLRFYRDKNERRGWKHWHAIGDRERWLAPAPVPFLGRQRHPLCREWGRQAIVLPRHHAGWDRGRCQPGDHRPRRLAPVQVSLFRRQRRHLRGDFGRQAALLPRQDAERYRRCSQPSSDRPERVVAVSVRFLRWQRHHLCGHARWQAALLPGQDAGRDRSGSQPIGDWAGGMAKFPVCLRGRERYPVHRGWGGQAAGGPR